MKKLILSLGVILIGATVVHAQKAEPPGGLSEIQAYSIFYENYKNEDYEAAIRYGEWIAEGMPRSLKGYSKFDLERNLDRLITAYSEASKNQQDPSVRTEYLNKALKIFEKAFNEFDKGEVDLFEWHMDKGRLYQEHSDFLDNAMKKASDEYVTAIKMNPERATKIGDGYYIQVTLQQLVSQGKKQEALDLIDLTEQYANQKTKEYFDKVRNQLFDSPEERIGFLENQIKKNPDNNELLRELAELYQQEQMLQKARETYQKLYEINPSFDNIMSLGEIAIQNANYDTAIRYLKEALDKTSQNQQKAQVAMKLSNAYMNKENLQTARRYARMAAQNDSDWGRPYLQIAQIYGQAVNQCTSGRKLEVNDKVVYWLVLDYLDRARRVDSSVSNDVQRQYKSYQPVTPTKEEIFFKNWEQGQKIKVDGSLMSCYDWISETTTVR